MIKEALEFFRDAVAARPHLVAESQMENTFFDKPVHRTPDPRKPAMAAPLRVATLASFADFIAHNIDQLGMGHQIIHVESPTRVVLLSELEKFHRRREVVLAAEYSSGVEDYLDKWVSLESFRVALMSLFQATEQRAEVLDVLQKIKIESAEVREDDGLSQKVTATAGTSTLRVAVVKNPVTLAPFRTFPEVEQPESPFILRLKDDPAVLLKPADGNAWKLQAVERVGLRLRELLAERKAEFPKVIF